MKKLLVVLLSLGLIVAFGTTASAADVKFGGSYYLVGVYESNPLLSPDELGQSHYSHAFFYQRFRLQPVFAIAEGLTFTARMDAMEKQWGQTDYKGNSVYMGQSTPDDLTATRGNSAAKVPRRGVQESLEFERAYVTFMTGIGMFQIGYQNVDDWGTDFGDYSNTRPRIAFVTKAGPVEIAFTYEKVFENDTATNPALAPVAVNATDADKDTYALSGTYKGKGLEAGLLYKYYAFNNNRPLGIKSTYNQISPYVKATFGPVYVEGEATYWFGKYAAFETPFAPTSGAPYAAGTQDIDLKAWSAYLKGKMNVGPAYFGGLVAYSSGDDLSDKTKATTAPSGAGTNFAPALLLMNDAMNTWNAGNSLAAGPWAQTSVLGSGPTGTVYNTITSNKYNVLIYNAFVGVNPTPKINVEMALTYAQVDKKALQMNWVTGNVLEAGSRNLGTEVDIKATYKIYDNLSYMIGAGYLWTGDYFKSVVNAAGTAVNERSVDNDYILLNQLTLSF
jgi:hypothetical protein